VRGAVGAAQVIAIGEAGFIPRTQEQNAYCNGYATYSGMHFPSFMHQPLAGIDFPPSAAHVTKQKVCQSKARRSIGWQITVRNDLSPQEFD
jgi:hypothetical protein